jgi:photosystem II stability/assembly factor-like uncharacterized protein
MASRFLLVPLACSALALAPPLPAQTSGAPSATANAVPAQESARPAARREEPQEGRETRRREEARGGKAGRRAADDKEESGKDEKEKEEVPWSAATFRGLSLRPLGPGIASGRVGDFAVDPASPKTYYVAVSSGGVWKTTNGGTTYAPIFDDQPSYSIGCLALDPNDSKVLWVGTGENNSQRSVSYGDGVYKSVDAGKTWKNVGLKASEHIGMIRVDPRDSDVVWVAAQGPLWSSGGDRGLYKTTDGGENWTRVLEIDEHTGVSEIHLDPRDPDVVYAVAYQRARRVWTLIDGGPGSAIHKSTDGGENWQKLRRGLPSEELGRIGLAISPADPDVVYAIVESAGKGEGFYRSRDAGASWEKRSDYVSDSPQYYQELVADPHDVDRVYSLDTLLRVTEDGGATWRAAGEDNKHVDNHALWIDPDDTEHLLVGCDGGIYESWDRAKTWQFKPNLPVTQFYKIALSNDEPFYYVYGGTQDNNTLGGPSRSRNEHGIENADWFVTTGGDGFQPAVDPTDPDIVYSESQYGGLVRYDRSTGETLDIKPREEPGEDPLRWNWDSPLVISPHSPSRLYYGAQRIYRSEDRGDSWEAVSGDLSRKIDRNRLEVMGKVWPIDAVAKNASTSIYGNVVAIDESPRVEGLLWAGTDDGLVWVREPESGEWRRIESLPGVPQRAYIADVVASRHAGDTVYVAPNHHKEGDFEPYLLKSTDRGRTFASIAGDLPERGSTWVLVEDPVDPDLLFVGTEFGLFFSVDGGGQWLRLRGGLPTIAVRDLEIHEREGDLVVGTFGRGFYVLDDYTALRQVDAKRLEGEAAILFPPRDPWMFVESEPSTGFLGHTFFTTPNPPYGATFTYYLKEPLETLSEARKKREEEIAKEGGVVPYPSWDELRAEEREAPPRVVLTVTDESGNVVRRLEGPKGKGIHRVSWDLRYPPTTPVSLGGRGDEGGFRRQPRGPFVVPGTYRVSLARVQQGEWTDLAPPVEFTTRLLGESSLPRADRAETLAFHRDVAELQRAVMGASRTVAETQTRIDHLQRAAFDTPGVPRDLVERLDGLEAKLRDLRVDLEGDATIERRNEAAPPGILERLQTVVRGQFSATHGPTGTHRRGYEIAAGAFGPWLERLRVLVETDLAAIERELDELGAPWTPGRVPRWSPR